MASQLRVSRKAFLSGGVWAVVSFVGCVASTDGEEEEVEDEALREYFERATGPGKGSGPGKQADAPGPKDCTSCPGSGNFTPAVKLCGGGDAVATPRNKWHPAFGVPKVHVDNPVGRIYDVHSQDHTHKLILTAENFEQLQSTGKLTLETLTAWGHEEIIDISCPT